MALFWSIVVLVVVIGVIAVLNRKPSRSGLRSSDSNTGPNSGSDFRDVSGPADDTRFEAIMSGAHHHASGGHDSGSSGFAGDSGHGGSSDGGFFGGDGGWGSGDSGGGGGDGGGGGGDGGGGGG